VSNSAGTAATAATAATVGDGSVSDSAAHEASYMYKWPPWLDQRLYNMSSSSAAEGKSWAC